MILSKEKKTNDYPLFSICSYHINNPFFPFFLCFPYLIHNMAYDTQKKMAYDNEKCNHHSSTLPEY